MNPVGIKSHPAPVITLIVTILALLGLPSSGVTVIDDAGMILTLDAPPSRIVSLAPSNTEILAALGLLDQLVGVTDVCDYPPEVKQIPRIGGYAAISIEKVSAARPDLVVASDITPKATVDRLKSLGLTVVVVSPRTIDDMLRDIRIVGAITGREREAEDLAERLSKQVAAVAQCSTGAAQPTVAHVVWHDPLYVSGKDTLQNDVILHAGGVNVFADRNGWSTVPLEEFLAKNPDVIIVSGGGGMDSSGKDVILEAFLNNPQYASLSAVRNNRVYAVNADIISRPAPRIVDAIGQVAGILHPECVPAPSATPGNTGANAEKTPGFGARSAILLISMVFILHRKRNG